MCSNDKKVVNHEEPSQAKEKITPRCLNEEKTEYIDEEGYLVIGKISDEMRSILDGFNLFLADVPSSKKH